MARDPGTEKHFDVDVMCLAVGLSPLTEMLWQAGCQMSFVPELGGHVPLRDENMETTVPGIYVAGDASGVEEASSAMIMGRLAGLAAAHSLAYCADFQERKMQALKELEELRSGPAGSKVKRGLSRVQVPGSSDKGGAAAC